MMNDQNCIEKCDYCNGNIIEKRLTIDFHHNGELVIIEDVPVKVCVECGEKYYDADVWEQLEKIAKSRTNIKKEILVPVKEYNLSTT
jgi:YgiT-type zinc finger domain-containing protein